jgi:hypothetical protein
MVELQNARSRHHLPLSIRAPIAKYGVISTTTHKISENATFLNGRLAKIQILRTLPRSFSGLD